MASELLRSPGEEGRAYTLQCSQGVLAPNQLHYPGLLNKLAIGTVDEAQFLPRFGCHRLLKVHQALQAARMELPPLSPSLPP